MSEDETLTLEDPRVQTVKVRYDSKICSVRVRKNINFEEIFGLFLSSHSFAEISTIIGISSQDVKRIYNKFFAELFGETGLERRRKNTSRKHIKFIENVQMTPEDKTPIDALKNECFGNSSLSILTPKFLIIDDVREIVRLVIEMVFSNPCIIPVKRNMCHVVVFVPSKKDDCANNHLDYQNYKFTPYLFYEESFGKKNEWPYEFDKISRCNALQLWHDCNDDQVDVVPHLLFSNDVPYCGGVKRYNIVVTCAGFQPYFGKMVSGMIADMIKAVVHQRFIENEGFSFFS